MAWSALVFDPELIGSGTGPTWPIGWEEGPRASLLVVRVQRRFGDSSN
jgi:hypothetical protein